ncbi:MAG: hypothetical protein JWN70_4043 [Planctomycetaceae bacterium]|nr:hypothetical protein [Planctomycetaceae bacterium]
MVRERGTQGGGFSGIAAGAQVRIVEPGYFQALARQLTS